MKKRTINLDNIYFATYQYNFCKVGIYGVPYLNIMIFLHIRYKTFLY